MALVRDDQRLFARAHEALYLSSDLNVSPPSQVAVPQLGGRPSHRGQRIAGVHQSLGVSLAESPAHLVDKRLAS